MPPTVFKAIEDGAVVSQRPIHRTLHVMSRPEVVSDESSADMAMAETDQHHSGVAVATPATVAKVAPPKHGFIEQLELDKQVRPPGPANERKEI